MNSKEFLYAAVLWIALILVLTPDRAAAQEVPQGMNYQAAMRDTLGLPLAGRTVSIRISIRRGAASGSEVYAESHIATTDDLGLFTIAIGRGTILAGAFPAIDWRLRDYWLDVAVDADGGTKFVQLGAQQLLSVPYALFAQRSVIWRLAT